MTRRTAIAAIASVVLFACAVPANAQTLAGTQWRVQEIAGEAVPAADRARTQLALGAKDNRMAASVGCNRMTGSYELIGNAVLHFGPIAATRMACPGDLGRRENAFLKALQSVRAWRIVEGTLILSDGDDRPVLRLVMAGKN